MHSESIFFATFREGKTNYSKDKWAYPDVITYQYQWIHQAAKQVGLKCIKINWTSPHLQIWVGFVKNDFDRKLLKKLKTINTLQDHRKKSRSKWLQKIVR